MPGSFPRWEIVFVLISCKSGKHSRVFPVGVNQEAREGAVCFGARVEAIVLRQRHLDPHLVSRDEVEQGSSGQRRRFGPVSVELEIGRHHVSVLHQVELQTGPVNCGVNGEVINPGDPAGEASGLRVVVSVLVEHDLVKVDGVAHRQGQSVTLGYFGAEGRFWGNGTLSCLTCCPLLSWVTFVPSQTSDPCLT